jgi:hypothetical protein
MSSSQWNEQLFNEFVTLRDGLRAAMREASYAQALSLGARILELHNTARYLRIATHLVLRDMGIASVAIGDPAAAETYFLEARSRFLVSKVKPEDWRREIAQIEQRLKQLRERESCPPTQTAIKAVTEPRPTR